MIKLFILLVLLVILISLGSALFHLVRGQQSSHKMAKALTVRIGLSVLLLLFVIGASGLGWIKPHTLLPSQSNAEKQPE